MQFKIGFNLNEDVVGATFMAAVCHTLRINKP